MYISREFSNKSYFIIFPAFIIPREKPTDCINVKNLYSDYCLHKYI